MSKKAVNFVKDRIEAAADDELPFDPTVEDIADRFNVKEKTAASYIYEATDLEHKWDGEGNHIIRKRQNGVRNGGGTQASVVRGVGQTGTLKMEAGEPTGKTFEGLGKLRDNDHPLIPEKTSYYRRRMEGHKSDVQIIARDLATDTPDGVQHVLLTGLPGVGKNQAIKHICAETNRPMVRIPVGGGIRYEDLIGHYSPTEAGGLEWTDGILTTAARYGYTVVLDEINMMSGDVSSPLHQVTEDQDSQELVIRQTGEVITPHPEFRVVATRNPNFAGAKRMNRAFLSRFSEHEMGYLSEEAEINVLTGQVDGLTADDIRPVVEYANELRDRYPQELDLIVTTRDLKRIGGYIADNFFDTKSAIRKVLLPRADPDTDRDPLRDEIDMKF